MVHTVQTPSCCRVLDPDPVGCPHFLPDPDQGWEFAQRFFQANRFFCPKISK